MISIQAAYKPYAGVLCSTYMYVIKIVSWFGISSIFFTFRGFFTLESTSRIDRISARVLKFSIQVLAYVTGIPP